MTGTIFSLIDLILFDRATTCTSKIINEIETSSSISANIMIVIVFD